MSQMLHGAGIFTYIYPKNSSIFQHHGACGYVYPIGSMYGIYANIYHQYTPVMLAYIPAP